jgi:hypothetical protein
MIGKGAIEVIGDPELTGAQAERSRLTLGDCDGPHFRQRLFVIHNKEGLTRLDASQECGEIALNLVHGYGTHGLIVPGARTPTRLASRLSRGPSVRVEISEFTCKTSPAGRY